MLKLLYIFKSQSAKKNISAMLADLICLCLFFLSIGLRSLALSHLLFTHCHAAQLLFCNTELMPKKNMLHQEK